VNFPCSGSQPGQASGQTSRVKKPEPKNCAAAPPNSRTNVNAVRPPLSGGKYLSVGSRRYFTGQEEDHEEANGGDHRGARPSRSSCPTGKRPSRQGLLGLPDAECRSKVVQAPQSEGRPERPRCRPRRDRLREQPPRPAEARVATERGRSPAAARQRKAAGCRLDSPPLQHRHDPRDHRPVALHGLQAVPADRQASPNSRSEIRLLEPAVPGKEMAPHGLGQAWGATGGQLVRRPSPQRTLSGCDGAAQAAESRVLRVRNGCEMRHKTLAPRRRAVERLTDGAVTTHENRCSHPGKGPETLLTARRPSIHRNVMRRVYGPRGYGSSQQSRAPRRLRRARACSPTGAPQIFPRGVDRSSNTRPRWRRLRGRADARWLRKPWRRVLQPLPLASAASGPSTRRARPPLRVTEAAHAERASFSSLCGAGCPIYAVQAEAAQMCSLPVNHGLSVPSTRFNRKTGCPSKGCFCLRRRRTREQGCPCRRTG